MIANTFGFAVSAGCYGAVTSCMAGQSGSKGSLNLTPGGALPPSAGSIATTELQQQTANPTGSNVAGDAAAALAAYQAAVAAANACPAGTIAQGDGTCQCSGYPFIATQDDGTCGPATWVLLVGGGLAVFLLLSVAIK